MEGDLTIGGKIDSYDREAAMNRMENSPKGLLGIGAMLGLWFAGVVALGASGGFVRAPGAMPLPILVGATAPLVVFLILFRGSPRIRAFVLNLDLSLITAIQAWRFAGFGFIALYAHDVLPGLFAWPAGLGDIAIGLTAPWLAIALTRRARFASSRLFIVWNILGVLDLVAAVGTGALSAALVLGPTTAPMAQLPLVLIPGFFVPLFVMLHLAALFQARCATSRDPSEPSRQTPKMALNPAV